MNNFPGQLDSKKTRWFKNTESCHIESYHWSILYSIFHHMVRESYLNVRRWIPLGRIIQGWLEAIPEWASDFIKGKRGKGQSWLQDTWAVSISLSSSAPSPWTAKGPSIADWDQMYLTLHLTWVWHWNFSKPCLMPGIDSFICKIWALALTYCYCLKTIIYSTTSLSGPSA